MVLRAFAPVERNPLVLSDVPVPVPEPGEILIEISRCGVCHTDLHTVEGDLPDVPLPRIPGHEIVGTVAGRGKGATRFAGGERVGAAWLHRACGVCVFCRSGRENLCLDGRFTGYQVDGGYAEYMRVPEKFAYGIPDAFTDDEAAPLLCSGIIGYRALKLSRIRPGGVLGLYGFGGSAHVAIQIARHWDCPVYVFSRGEGHRAHAQSLGAAWTGTIGDTPPSKLDAAIIFAPAGGLVPEALSVLERGGTLVLAGITMTAIPEMDYGKHMYYEKTLRSVANATREDGDDLLRIAGEIPIKTATTVHPLEDANAVLRSLKEGAITGAAVLRI